MIDVNRLTLIDGLGYALEDIKAHTSPEVFNAFTKWFGDRPHYLSQDGKKCIHSGDLQLYIRLRANALKRMDIKK